MKYLTLIAALLLTSCITHKDLAQVEANAYEKALALHRMQKVENYIRLQVNAWFAWSEETHKFPFVYISDVSILKIETVGENENRYLRRVILMSQDVPYLVTKMTIDVPHGFQGIGQFTFQDDPWGRQ